MALIRSFTWNFSVKIIYLRCVLFTHPAQRRRKKMMENKMTTDMAMAIAMATTENKIENITGNFLKQLNETTQMNYMWFM